MPGPVSRFYDDQIYNIDNVGRNESVEAIHVPLEYVPDVKSYQDFLFDESSGWDLRGEDADLMNLIIHYSFSNPASLEHLPAFGLTNGHLYELQGFVIQHSHRKSPYKNVMFDWDYVINLQEGFSAPLTLSEFDSTFNNNDDVKITPATLMKFMIGTKSRLKLIRDTLRLCRIYKFGTHIVTNNSGCNTEVYPAIVRALDPKLVIHCSSGNKFGGDKLLCMIDHNLLPPVGSGSPISSSFGKSIKQMKKHGFRMYMSS